METPDTELLIDHPRWRDVLSVYQDLIEKVAESRDPEESGVRWANRVAHFGDIDPQTLTAIHGQLIAMDYLTFQIGDRNSGLMYRITAEGRKALEEANSLADLCEEEIEETEDATA